MLFFFFWVDISFGWGEEQAEKGIVRVSAIELNHQWTPSGIRNRQNTAAERKSIQEET